MIRVDIEALERLLAEELADEQRAQESGDYDRDRPYDEWWAACTYLEVCKAAHEALPAILAELRASRDMVSAFRGTAHKRCRCEECDARNPNAARLLDALRAYDEATK